MNFAIKGSVSGELLTFHGRILTHTNRGEMEFLFPAARIVPYDGDLPTLPVRDHPDMASVRWPLRKEDFR